MGDLPHVEYEKGTVWAKGLGDVNCYVLTEKTNPGSYKMDTEEDEDIHDLKTEGPMNES